MTAALDGATVDKTTINQRTKEPRERMLKLQNEKRTLTHGMVANPEQPAA